MIRISAAVIAHVVILDGLPLFLGHFEGVWSVDPEGVGFGQFLSGCDESVSFPAHIDEDSTETYG